MSVPYSWGFGVCGTLLPPDSVVTPVMVRSRRSASWSTTGQAAPV